MKVIILAAGRGSRMTSETSDKPKCLIEYREKPLLSHALDSVKKFVKIEDILIIGGYRSELIEKFGPRMRRNSEWERTNIMGSLMVASDVLSLEECLVIYSDIYFDAQAVELMLSGPKPGILNLLNWQEIWETRFENPLEDLESFRSQGEFVSSIGGRVEDYSDVQGQFGGMYSLTPETWNLMAAIPNLRNLDTTTALNELISTGVSFADIKYSGYWAEFDSIVDLRKQFK